MKRKRNTTLKKTAIALVIVLAFSVIIGYGVYLSRPKEKKPPAEYFEILDPALIDREYRNPTVAEGGGHNTSKYVIVYGIQFKLKAVGGDAHNVIIDGWGSVEPIGFASIAKDQYEIVTQTSNHPLGVRITRDEMGRFPFEVRIASDETLPDGTIIIYF